MAGRARVAGCSGAKVRKFFMHLAAIAATIVVGGLCIRAMEDGPATEAIAARHRDVVRAVHDAGLTQPQIDTLTAAGILTMQPAPSPWTLMGSWFFCLATVTTIGYGNLSPTTAWGRVFTVVYAVCGICVVGQCLTDIAELLLSGLMRLAQRVSMALNPYPRVDAEGELTPASREQMQKWFHRFDADDSGALDRRQLEALLVVMNSGKDVTAKEVTAVLQAADVNQDGLIQEDELEKAVKAWYNLIPVCPKTEVRMQVTFGVCLSIANAVIFAWIFQTTEEWSAGDAYWFTMVTMLTIGYGDLYPTSKQGRVLVYLFTGLALSTLAYIIGAVSDLVMMSWSKHALKDEAAAIKEDAHEHAHDHEGEAVRQRSSHHLSAGGRYGSVPK